MQRVLAWVGGIGVLLILVIAGLTVAAGFVVHARAVPHFEAKLFVTHDAATATPAAYGVAYQSLTINSHGRALRAFAVDAGPHTPAILFFHGNGQTIRDLGGLQAYLFRHRVSSMVFDYSGFGRSTGNATVHNLDEDAVAAWQAFAAWVGPRRAKFAIGYSLGTGVLLHSAPGFDPQPDGVAVYGAFSSAINEVVYLRGIPGALAPWLEPVVPDVWDNVTAATRLRVPLLVVAGNEDTKVPPDMGRPIALYAGDGGRYVLLAGLGHGGIVSHMDAAWAPILDFMQHHAPRPVNATAAAARTPAPASQSAGKLSAAGS